MSETFTATDEKRLGIVLKGQDNYLLWSTEKCYKLRSRALWKYVTGEAAAPADDASSEDKEKYTFGESQAFWLIYESVGLELRSYIENQTARRAWEILKGLYAKVGWVSHHLGLEALIDTHLGDSLEEYCTKYKAAAEQTKQLSEEIPCSNTTCTRPTRNGVTDTQITGIFLRNLGDYYQNFRDSKITPGRKENTPPALNDLIADLLGLKLYKEAHQSVNDEPSAMSLGAQPLLNRSYTAPVATPDKKWCDFHKSPNHWTRNCRAMKTPTSKPKSKKRRFAQNETPPDQSDD